MVNYNPLLSSLVEIINGSTGFDLNGQALFFRHFNLEDQNNIQISYNKYREIAIKKGIESELDIYERLKKDDCWSDDDDLKIAELKDYVSNLKKSKSKILLPSQRDSHQKLIDDEEDKLNLLLSKKQELISTTAENYAEKMSNEEFLRLLLFKDKELKEKKFSDDDFGELNTSDVLKISNKYFEMSKHFTDDNIQKIVLEDFFSMYLSCCEDPYVFFGKFIYQLSIYQMKLMLYAKIFNNIFQYHDDIPEEIKKNPKEIFDFIEVKKNREKYQNDSKDSDGTILFGATSKDLDILDPSARKISLSDQIAKNGGSLNMEDMMKLMGN